MTQLTDKIGIYIAWVKCIKRFWLILCDDRPILKTNGVKMQCSQLVSVSRHRQNLLIILLGFSDNIMRMVPFVASLICSLVFSVINRVFYPFKLAYYALSILCTIYLLTIIL